MEILLKQKWKSYLQMMKNIEIEAAKFEYKKKLNVLKA
jgi:hypothetical protein